MADLGSNTIDDHEELRMAGMVVGMTMGKMGMVILEMVMFWSG